MTAPQVNLKVEQSEQIPMRLDCRPDLTLTMTAVLTPNAAHATSVARPVAMVVILIGQYDQM